MSAAGTTWRAMRAPPTELTPLQRRICALVEMHRSRPQIATALGISVDAVKRHLSEIRDWQAMQMLRRAQDVDT